MGMRTHVVAFKPPDKKWQQMKNIWDLCVALKVDPPEEVQKFFGSDEPITEWVKVEIQGTKCVCEYKEDDSIGFEVVLDELPKDVKTIRFLASRR